jgi:large subunit ribosomal protein L10
MKTRAKKQEDLVALTEQLKDSTSAMVLSFSKLTVAKDQEFRNELRETGAKYKVVKNTLARLAVEGTPFEDAKEHFKGVTSIATTSDEPIDMSKVIAKYIKANKDVFEFKTGIVDGRVIDFTEVETIASLPSKEELIGKLLFLLNAPAQRMATVLNAIPRDLAIVLKQTSERTDNLPGETAPEEAKADDSSEEKAEAETSEDAKAEDKAADPVKTEEAAADEKPADAETKDEEPEEAKADDSSEEKADEQSEEKSEE